LGLVAPIAICPGALAYRAPAVASAETVANDNEHIVAAGYAGPYFLRLVR
jgi:hypothetical protein